MTHEARVAVVKESPRKRKTKTPADGCRCVDRRRLSCRSGALPLGTADGRLRNG